MAAPGVCQIAFVRAIMIGREGLHREVVLDLFRRAGAVDPISYISTGNVSFEAPASQVPRIVGEVEAGIEQIVGRPKPLYVRTLDQLVAMVGADPFSVAPFGGGQMGEVVFFRGPVPAIDLPYVSTTGNLSVFAASARELFSVSRRIGARTPEAPGGTIERLTGEQVTVRAWSTVTTIVAKLTR